jgi:flagellar L-ring protein FlgH
MKRRFKWEGREFWPAINGNICGGDVRTILGAFLGFCLAAGAAADSLWPSGSQNTGSSASLVSDQRALSVGDLVTIQIVENATATQATSIQTQKQANVSGGAGLGSWNNNTSMPLQGYGAGAQESMAGSGSSARSGNLVATISARVVNVLHNGNLYIEGRKTIQVNDEKQHIFISGIIRPKDVGPSNMVVSSNISDAQIRYEGRGPLSEKSRAGIFTRILDWLGLF